jgi:hypothetical protein
MAVAKSSLQTEARTTLQQSSRQDYESEGSGVNTLLQSFTSSQQINPIPDSEEFYSSLRNLSCFLRFYEVKTQEKARRACNLFTN